MGILSAAISHLLGRDRVCRPPRRQRYRPHSAHTGDRAVANAVAGHARARPRGPVPASLGMAREPAPTRCVAAAHSLPLRLRVLRLPPPALGGCAMLRSGPPLRRLAEVR